MGVDPSLVSAMLRDLHLIERQLHYCKRFTHRAKSNLFLSVLPDEDGLAVFFLLTVLALQQWHNCALYIVAASLIVTLRI